MFAHCLKLFLVVPFTVLGALPAQVPYVPPTRERDLAADVPNAKGHVTAQVSLHPHAIRSCLGLQVAFVTAPAVEVIAHAQSSVGSGHAQLPWFNVLIRMNGTTRDSALATSLFGVTTFTRLKTVLAVLPGTGAERVYNRLGSAFARVATNYSATGSFSGAADFPMGWWGDRYEQLHDSVSQLTAVGTSTLVWSSANQVASVESQLNYGTHVSHIGGFWPGEGASFRGGRMTWTFGQGRLRERATLQAGGLTTLCDSPFATQSGQDIWVEYVG